MGQATWKRLNLGTFSQVPHKRLLENRGQDISVNQKQVKEEQTEQSSRSEDKEGEIWIPSKSFKDNGSLMGESEKGKRTLPLDPDGLTKSKRTVWRTLRPGPMCHTLWPVVNVYLKRWWNDLNTLHELVNGV